VRPDETGSAVTSLATQPVTARRPSTAQHDARRERAMPELVDIATVATSLGVGVRHVRRLVAERRIPFVKVGHFVRFDPRELHAWVDERRVSARRAR